MRIQRNFARADYEGLEKAQREALRAKRTELARNLRKNYRDTMKDIDSLGDLRKYKSVITKGAFSGGGVGSIYKVITTPGSESADVVQNIHKNSVRDRISKNLKDIKGFMREQVEKTVAPDVASKQTDKLSGLSKSEKKIIKEASKKGLSKNQKIALGIAAGTAAAGTAGYLAYRHHKNKQQKED